MNDIKPSTNDASPRFPSTALPGSGAIDGKAPAASATGAQHSLAEQANAINDHEERVSVTRRVIDGLASDAATIGVTVEQTLEDIASSPEEWVDASRTVVRANPLLAVGGAALIGIAIGVLASRTVNR